LERPRLIVTDLDGTLLPETKRISPYTRDVLLALKAEGVQVAVATGKFYHLAAPYAATFGPDTPIIALDGVRTSLGPGQPEEVEGIGTEVLLGLLDELDEPGMELFLDSGADEMLLRYGEAEVPPVLLHWAERRRRVDDVRPHLVGDSGILTFFSATRSLAHLGEALAQRFGGLRASAFFSGGLGRERLTFQPRDVNKGTAVRRLCDRLGVAPAECMVFGDWFNDVPLFRAGCFNVAMANAQPEVKALAHRVTPLDCEHDGVARFLAGAFL